MISNPSLLQMKQAADFISMRFRKKPRVGVVLGTGLGTVVDGIKDKVVIPYSDIPHFPVSSVDSHDGNLVLGTWNGKVVMVMQGRIHFYEGHSKQKITFPIRTMQLLGVKTLIVTNAAGGLNPDYNAGDLMMITDHINFSGLAGFNVLRGPNEDSLGLRFPSMVTTYDLNLQKIVRKAAKKLKLDLHEGIYINVSGPNFETPAEIRFFRMIGGDAVGMSTTPEILVGVHADMKIIGLSGITNKTYRDPNDQTKITLKEVIDMNEVVAPKMKKLLNEIMPNLR